MFDACILDIQESIILCWMGFKLILIYSRFQDQSCLKHHISCPLIQRSLKTLLYQKHKDSARIQGQRHGYPLNPETIVLAF